MQNNEKNYEGAESEERKKNKKKNKKQKKIIFNRKKESGGKGSFNYEVRKISVKFGPLLALPLYSQTSNFGLSTPHSWTPLIGIL